MIRKLFSFVLALALLWAIPLPVRAEEPESIHPELLIPALKTFFAGAEGDYTAVNPSDNGALSVGLLQWHGRRALELVRRAAASDPDAALKYLGRDLYEEVQQPGTTWDRRTLTPGEGAAVSALLGSEAGRRAQDDLAAADITVYIDAARRAGMRTDATVFYYAVIYNQFGVGGAGTYLGHIRAVLGVGEKAVFYDLDQLHAAVHAVKSYGTAHLGQRDKAYAFVISLGWWSPRETGGAPGAPVPGAPPEGAGESAPSSHGRLQLCCVRQERVHHLPA